MKFNEISEYEQAKPYTATQQEEGTEAPPDAVPYMKMTPLARRIAEERGLSADEMKGSGHMGKIFTNDFSFSAAGAAPYQDRKPPQQYQDRPYAQQTYQERPPETPSKPIFTIVPQQEDKRIPASAEAATAASQPQPPAQTSYLRTFSYTDVSQAPAQTRTPYAPPSDPSETAQNQAYTRASHSQAFDHTEPAQSQAYTRSAPSSLYDPAETAKPQAYKREAPQQEQTPIEPVYHYTGTIKPPPAQAQSTLEYEYTESAPPPRHTPQSEPSPKAMVAAAIAADEDVAGIIRMNDARRSVALQTARSSAKTAAVTQHMETDITELVSLIRHINADRDKQDLIPASAFYIKAMAVCVREKDRFRIRLADAEDAYLLIDGAHIGFQVGVGDALATPVLRDADLKPIGQVAAEITLLTDKSKRGGLTENDVKGGAITLIEKGDSGIHTFTPIINLPESAILGIGASYQRLVMTEKSIENRYFIMQSLTFDHRVINGNEADEFQKRFKEILENPRSLLG